MNLIDINMLGGLQGMLGDEIFSITQLYAEQVGPDIENIVSCHAKNDMVRLKQLAHALKGSSANLGALEMTKLAGAIERGAAAGNAAGVTDAVQALAETARMTLEAMRSAKLLR